MFDKLKCIDNIYAMAKTRNMNVGELEQTAEVSRGYLSRLAKEGNSANPSIDLIVSIAEHLNVSIDSIVNDDMVHLSSKEQYVYNFVHKVKRLTENGKIEWFRTKVYKEQDNEGNTFYRCDGDMYNGWFKSEFVEDYVIKEGIVYLGKIPNSNERIMIINLNFRMEFSDGEDTGYDPEAIEIYITKNSRREGSSCNPICSSAYVVKELKKEIEDLNSYVFAARSRIGLNDVSKNTIENFMNNLDDDGNVKNVMDGFMDITDNTDNAAVEDELPFV